MLVAGHNGEGDEDLELPPDQRLGLVEAVGCLQQRTQVVEICGDFGMLGTIAVLVDGKGTGASAARPRRAG